MKVSELIATLQSLNPELMVVVSGYEGGAVEVSTIDICRLKLDANPEEYYGPHEPLEDDEPGGVSAVWIGG